MKNLFSLTALRLLNILSLVFVITNMTVLLFIDGHHHGGLFIWSLMMMLLTLWWKHHLKYYGILVIPWTALPFLLRMPYYQGALTGIIAVLLMLLFLKNLEKADYNRVEYEFGMGMTVGFVIFSFSLLGGRLDLFSEFAAGYMILYVISGVIMMRSLRYMDYLKETEQMRKMNLRGMVIVTVSAIAVTSDLAKQIMGGLLSGVWFFYGRLVDLFIWIVYYPVYYLGMGFGLLWERFILWFFRDAQVHEDEGAPDALNPGEAMEEMRESLREEMVEANPFIRFVAALLIILLLAYIVYRIYTWIAAKGKQTDEYEENREMISPAWKGHLWNRLKERMRPKTREEKIRRYYGKFIKHLKEREVVVLPSDTTADLHRKAEGVHSPEELRIFREIYMAVRYGDQKASLGQYKIVKEIYQSITREKKQKS